VNVTVVFTSGVLLLAVSVTGSEPMLTVVLSEPESPVLSLAVAVAVNVPVVL